MTGLKDTVAAKRAELDKAPAAPSAGAFEAVRANTEVLRIIGLDPRDPKSHAVVAVADRYGLDPVLGHIMILGASRLPYVTRDGYLHIAHANGHLDGIEVVDGPRREGAEWVAKVAVYRDDMARAFVYPGRADVGRDNAPEMALARAERRALKRAFAVTLPRVFAEDEYDTRAAREPVTEAVREDDPAPGDQRPAGDVTSPAPSPAAPPIIDAELPDDDPFAKPLDNTARRSLLAALRKAGITTAKQCAAASELLGRGVAHLDELTVGEAAEIVARLAEQRIDTDLGRDGDPDE